MKCMVFVFLFTSVLVSCSLSRPQQFFIDDYPVRSGNGPVFYVDPDSGSDSADGLSTNTAWKTVYKVNTAVLPGGSTVRFKRGGVWRERINPQSGQKDAWITYSDYGAGPRPLFLGSVEANSTNDWTSVGANLWMFTGFVPDDAGNILFNNAVSGTKVWSLPDVNASGRFFYDKTTGRVTLYATANPATLYTDIEIWTGQHMVYTPRPEGSYQYAGSSGVSNIIFENLAFQYGGAYALKFQGVHHIIIRNCEIAWCGGAELEGRPQVRYGNGIEFYGYVFYSRALSNIIYEMYDSGVSVQCVDGSPVACGVEFRDNIISNCALASYELWYSYEAGNVSILSNISFTGNRCYNAGGGWGVQRPDESGYHVYMGPVLGASSGIVISNNYFRESKRWFFAQCDAFNNYAAAVIDYNTWSSGTNAKAFLRYRWGDHAVLSEFDLTQAAEYRSLTGYGAHSSFLIE